MANRDRPLAEPAARGAEVETDKALWREVTQGVTPLRRPPQGDAPTATPPPVPQPIAGRPRPVISPAAGATSRPVPELAPGSAPGIDQRLLNRLKRGLIPPETRIDLHAMTEEQAHRALTGFLAAAQAAGRRSVLVITGKGFRGAGRVGVLKTNVPRWLNEEPTRGRVLAFTHATQADGGEGALYVLLRRLRSPGR
jgi:DNA-nicking Smr family endonuclease